LPKQPATLPASSPTRERNETASAPEPDIPSIAPADANELCELFFTACGPERRLILLNLDYSPWPAEPLPSPFLRADIWRLETAVLRHNTASVLQELERALGISSRQAHRIVEDDLGDPIVAAAKAMGLPSDVLQRILLFLNPRVGQSIGRIYELAALYDEISVQAARRLIAIMRAAEAAERRAPPDTRALHAVLEAARGSSPQVANTSAKRPDTPRHRAFGSR
jgi:hypothetical protein